MSVATLSVSMEQRRDVSRHQRARTSRCLFERPDMEDLQRKYEEQSREEMRRFKEEWGFDPERGCPVVGHVRFQWEPMQPETKKEQPQQLEQDVPVEPSPSPEDQPSQSPKFNTTRPLKQSSMKDYFAERKRSGEAAAASSSTAAVVKKRRQSEGSSSDEATSSSSSSQQVN